MSGRVSTAAVALTACTVVMLGSPARGLAQSVTLAPAGSLALPVDLVEVEGQRAYAVSGMTLRIVDLSDPATPTQVGAYTFSNYIMGLRVIGGVAYVAADRLGLGILDVSTPSAPVLRGTVKTHGQAKNVAVAGTMALVTDTTSGLEVFDIADPAKARQLGSVYLEGFATDVVARGTLAIAADRPTGFYVFDLSKAPPFEPVAALQQAGPGNSSRAQLDLIDTAQGRIATLVAGGMLQLFDISTPAAPVKLTPFRTPGGAQRVAVRGHVAFVADGAAGVQVVDFSNPSAPQIVGTFKTAAPARDIAVNESLVVVALGNGELVVLR